MSTNIIQAIRDLSAKLVEETLSPEALAQEIGNVQPDGTHQYTVTPTASEFSNAMIILALSGNDVNSLRLSLADKLPLATLEAAFGAYKTAPRKPKQAPTVRFTVDVESATHRVTLIAALHGQDVSEITLRRDIRLG